MRVSLWLKVQAYSAIYLVKLLNIYDSLLPEQKGLDDIREQFNRRFADTEFRLASRIKFGKTYGYQVKRI